MRTTDKRPLKVFLCHASTDKPKVRELYRYLKKRGIQPWFDEEDLVGGQDWQVEIPKALATSDAIIICLTKNSVDKEGYIQKEIKFALDKALEMPEGRIFLIPVKFEECEVPFTLSRYQWVDLTIESGYAKMMKALKFRASQLERSTVEVSKKDVEEENLVREKAEKEAVEKPRLEAEELERQKTAREKAESEAAERDRKAKEFRDKQAHESREKEKRETEKKEGKPATIKPKAGGQIAYWFGGLFVLVLSGLFLSSINNPLLNEQTPTMPPTEDTQPIEMSMAIVPAGSFVMGSDRGNDVYQPAHEIYLDTFYMDIYEVTNSAYGTCVSAGVCTPPRDFSSATRPGYYNELTYANYPVIYIDWNQAQTYCQWRGGRLPTEAQWEKAARGTDQRTYPWGEEIDCNKANYKYNSYCIGDTARVGGYESGKSPYGMYDMAGNVWEWVADWYSETYYQNSPSANPMGPGSGDYRVLRGGSWINADFKLASMQRAVLTNPDDLNNVGFRCVSNVP